MLAEKVDEKSIIQAAWNSDEQQFKQSYIESIGKDIETGEKSYNAFQKGMKQLVVIRRQNINISENIRKNKKTLSDIRQILDGKSYELESSKFKDIEHIIRKEDNISTNTPEMENNLSFTQKIARFFEKHESLMNIPFVKNFVNKRLNVLPPVGEQEGNNVSSFNSRRNNFINELSNNGEYIKLEPIQYSEKINSQNIEENER